MFEHIMSEYKKGFKSPEKIRKSRFFFYFLNPATPMKTFFVFWSSFQLRADRNINKKMSRVSES